ncbi:archaeal conserved hypothetical protein [Thermoplasmatales archaeon BRNA1]|nr:archaeal conserved hypothetical protein [Thermoplasmatales archaeon BRNA1]
MDSSRETEAGSRFSCTESERASFEAGIKMATVYHQFVGTPFSEKNKADLERSIEKCIMAQPYVESARVKISVNGGDKGDQYTYTSLTGDMIDAIVVILLGKTRVTAEMRYDNVLRYPLMYVSSVEKL